MAKKVLIFNNTDLELTQGQNDTPSHQGISAIDIVNHNGKPELTLNIDVKCVAHGSFGESDQCYFESLERVQFADGTSDYLCFYVDHSRNLTPVGKIIKAGQNIITMGNKGLGDGGAHYHVMYGKGHITKARTFHRVQKNDYGYSYNPDAFNSRSANTLFFKDKNTKITYLYDAKHLPALKDTNVEVDKTSKEYRTKDYYLASYSKLDAWTTNVKYGGLSKSGQGKRTRTAKLFGNYINSASTFGYTSMSVNSKKLSFPRKQYMYGWLLESKDSVVWFEWDTKVNGKTLYLDVAGHGKLYPGSEVWLKK